MATWKTWVDGETLCAADINAIQTGKVDSDGTASPEFVNLYKNQPWIYRSKKVSLSSPYTSKAHVYKGQLHCHTTNSDGAQSPTVLVTAYRDAGYDFISITDHDFNTPDPGVSGILFIPGVEDGSNGNHLVRINAATAGNGGTAGQAVIDLALAAGSFVHIAHPNFSYSTIDWTDVELESLEGYYGAEVWNSLVSPDQNAEDRIDTLLSAYRKLYLLAVDDCHDVTAAYAKTASVRVFADNLTLSEIMENLKRGNFYSSNGADISSITVSKRTITVTTPVAGTIDFIGTGGAVKQTKAAATSDTYTVFGNEVYVRIKITRDSDGKIAWTNPVYVLEESVAELAKGGVIRGNVYITGVSTFNDPNQINHIKVGDRFFFIGQSNFHLTNNVYYGAPDFYYAKTGGLPGKIQIGADGSFSFQNAPAGTADTIATFTTRLIVKSDGKVGIGVADPAYVLDLGIGAVQAQIGSVLIGDWAAVAGWALFGNRALNQTLATQYSLVQDNVGNTYINAPTGAVIAFRINNVNKMRLTAAGYLGINDVDPGEYLDVNGNANVTGVYKTGDIQVVGAQAATQAALKADYTTGDLDTEAEIIAAINASNAGHNSLLAKIKTHGLVASA